jgi:hypothetical protein
MPGAGLFGLDKSDELDGVLGVVGVAGFAGFAGLIVDLAGFPALEGLVLVCARAAPLIDSKAAQMIALRCREFMGRFSFGG